MFLSLSLYRKRKPRQKEKEKQRHHDAAQNHNFDEAACSVMTMKGFLFYSNLLLWPKHCFRKHDVSDAQDYSDTTTNLYGPNVKAR